MINEVEFYCPVYEGKISQYDCDEISTGIHRGSFINDGIPFLMELDTALSRRRRCIACERCPEEYRPWNRNSLNDLKHLGYPQSDADELPGAVMDVISKHAAGRIRKLNGRFDCCQLPSGIQLWYEWDPQLDQLVDFKAHYASANSMYMRIDTLNKSKNYGQLTCSRVFAGLRPYKNQDKVLFHSAIEVPDLHLYRDEYMQDDPVVQVCAFPEELAYFDSVGEYKIRRNNKLAEESFVSGTAFDECGRANMPDHGMITGVIKSATKVINEVTGLPFYHLEVNCLGMIMDVVANPDLLPAIPKKGAVLQGVFRFSARVIDFWFTGYVFNITIETPLTMRRFGTIRTALTNMQPGERMSCDINPALGNIELVRVKCEVEGMSVEFKVRNDDQGWQFLRFYPISREESIKVFERTLVYEDPPSMDNARDVTDVYQDEEDELTPDGI